LKASAKKCEYKVDSTRLQKERGRGEMGVSVSVGVGVDLGSL